MIRSQALKTVRRGRVITLLGLVGLAAVFVRAIAFTPVERLQGPAQKIMYVHVPAAWAALGAFALTGVLSILYLWLKDRRLDFGAAASAEVGVAFGVVMLVTGPIWGKPVWGTWWAWDPRLTSTLFLFLLFVAYLLFRGSVTDPETRGRFSAVIGILGFVLIPFVHLTVYMFPSLHPEPVVLKPEGATMPGEMLTTLVLGAGAYLILYFGFVLQRYALTWLDELHEEALQSAS